MTSAAQALNAAADAIQEGRTGCVSGRTLGATYADGRADTVKYLRIMAAAQESLGDASGRAINTAPQRATGLDLIAAERSRQVTGEGWTPEHDGRHPGNDLALAAATYALPASWRRMRTNISGDRAYGQIPEHWPWHSSDYKPTPDDRVRELVKAGALIAAEIDRLQRAGGDPA